MINIILYFKSEHCVCDELVCDRSPCIDGADITLTLLTLIKTNPNRTKRNKQQNGRVEQKTNKLTTFT